MDIRGKAEDIVDAEFVVVGAIALVGLLASARATAFRPPMALGIVYVPTAVVVGLQWYRGVAFGVHHAATVACMSVLAAALLVVSGDLSTAQATVVTVVALMLLVGSASLRYRPLLGGLLAVSVPILTVVEYRVQYADRPALGSRMVPSLTELLVFWILVAGFAIALGFPVYALGRWSEANVSAAR